MAGTTSTQALLAYSAPDSRPCQLRVSEEGSPQSLVHDLDPALFPGADSDAGGERERFWVVGKRTVHRGRDGNLYSRALQANTTHSYRLVCGGGSAAGSFRTTNVPSGKTFGEPALVDPDGGYVFPTVQETRGYSVIDPMTGVLVRRVSLTADAIRSKPPATYDGGFFHNCANQLTSTGGFRCTFPGSSGVGRMYWIDPADGSSRFLGIMRHGLGADYVAGYNSVTNANFDPQTPDVFYTTAQTEKRPPWKTVILKGTYVGRDKEVRTDEEAPFQYLNLTPGKQTLTDLIAAFDPRFDPLQFGQRCDIYGVQLDYLVIACRRWQQDSAAWMVVVKLGDRQPPGRCAQCLRVIAAMPIYANPTTRWCGHHSTHYLGDSPFTILTMQKMFSRGTTGPWEVTLRHPLDEGGSLLQVSGEPSSGFVPPDGVNFLQDAAPGDVFHFQDGSRELVRITAKESATSWRVQRGYGKTKASAHAAETKLAAFCDQVRTQKANIWWRFLDDPHGSDASNTLYIEDREIGGGHRVSREPFDISEGYVVRVGPWPQQFNQSPTFFIEESPAFAGLQSQAPGNSYQKHPSYDQPAAPPAEKLWFLDVWPFFGGMYKGDRALPISGDLYRYQLGKDHQFDAAKLPYFALSGPTRLRDVSGLGSRLSSQPADHHKFCLVKSAGECVAGSLPGEIYFNVPNLKYPYCRSSDSVTPTAADICIQHTATYGHALVQIGLTPADRVGTTDGKPRYGAGKSRVLVSGALLGKYRRIGSTSSPHPLPDGSWAIFPSRLVDVDTTTNLNHIFIAKVPPQPPDDGVDRSRFIEVAVDVPARAGALAARVEYGYEEYGQRTDFRCTQRPEPCSLRVSAGGEARLPAIPQRVLLYRVQYLDKSGGVIFDSPLAAAIVP